MLKISLLILPLGFVLVACVSRSTKTPTAAHLVSSNPTALSVSGTISELPIGIRASPDYMAYLDGILGANDFISSDITNLGNLKKIHRAQKVLR